MQIQQRRHSLRVSKPPISTDYAEPAPDYASALADRQPQSAFAPRSATPEQTAITSTRTAFARYALFRNSWSEALRQQVQTLQVPGKGWQRGLNLNRSVNDVVDGDTNAIVLESPAYISRGQMLCLACLSPTLYPRPQQEQRHEADLFFPFSSAGRTHGAVALTLRRAGRDRSAGCGIRPA